MLVAIEVLSCIPGNGSSSSSCLQLTGSRIVRHLHLRDLLLDFRACKSPPVASYIRVPGVALGGIASHSTVQFSVRVWRMARGRPHVRACPSLEQFVTRRLSRNWSTIGIIEVGSPLRSAKCPADGRLVLPPPRDVAGGAVLLRRNDGGNRSPAGLHIAFLGRPRTIDLADRRGLGDPGRFHRFGHTGILPRLARLLCAVRGFPAHPEFPVAEGHGLASAQQWSDAWNVLCSWGVSCRAYSGWPISISANWIHGAIIGGGLVMFATMPKPASRVAGYVAVLWLLLLCLWVAATFIPTGLLRARVLVPLPDDVFNVFDSEVSTSSTCPFDGRSTGPGFASGSAPKPLQPSRLGSDSH